MENPQQPRLFLLGKLVCEIPHRSLPFCFHSFGIPYLSVAFPFWDPLCFPSLSFPFFGYPICPFLGFPILSFLTFSLFWGASIFPYISLFGPPINSLLYLFLFGIPYLPLHFAFVKSSFFSFFPLLGSAITLYLFLGASPIFPFFWDPLSFPLCNTLSFPFRDPHLSLDGVYSFPSRKPAAGRSGVKLRIVSGKPETRARHKGKEKVGKDGVSSKGKSGERQEFPKKNMCGNIRKDVERWDDSIIWVKVFGRSLQGYPREPWGPMDSWCFIKIRRGPYRCLQ